jgi:hypothetical protein
VIQKAGIGGQGGGVPFAIEGSTSDPKFVPNVKAIAGSAAKQAIAGKVSGTKGANPLTEIFGRKKN